MYREAKQKKKSPIKTLISMWRNKKGAGARTLFFFYYSSAYISTWHAIRHLTNTMNKPMLRDKAQLLSNGKERE